MAEEMKKFMNGKMLMDVTNGEMIFVNTTPEVFKVRIERVRTREDDPKNVIADVAIRSDGKFERVDIIVNTANLSDEAKEYLKTHTKDEMIDWFTPRFLERIPGCIRRLVQLHMHKDKDIQIFLDPWKFNVLVRKIVDSAYIIDLMKGDENDD